MKPFKLRVDWTSAEPYVWEGRQYPGHGVVVELSIMGEVPRTLRRFTRPEEATRWAVKWLRDRGLDFYCDIDTHQRCDHTHITLHARPPC